MNALDKKELIWRQGLTLDEKILMSQERIEEWFDHWSGAVYVSFSGGKDSTVLLHLVRSLYPDVAAVFIDTGLEYPEVRRFAKGQPDVTVLRPEMPFQDVIERYGFPVVSKEVSQKIEEIRQYRDTQPGDPGYKTLQIRLHGKGPKKTGKLPEKWRFLSEAPFKVSHKCCNVMKKKPIKRYERETGNKPFIGTMAVDAFLRETAYLKKGCNAFDGKRPRSTPMGFWLESDVWEYIDRFGLEVASVYGKGYDRTGCMFCMFGVPAEYDRTGTHRFERMRETHPKQYNYCMDVLGCRAVMHEIGIPLGDEEVVQKQLDLFK